MKDADRLDTSCVESRGQAERATWLGIAGNVFLAAVKLFVGAMTSSAALVADGLHSLSDVVSSVIVLAGLKIASLPADEEHPYGHGKAEAIAAKLVAVILFLVGVATAAKALYAMGDGAVLAVPGPAAAFVAFISIVLKECLYRYKMGVAVRTGSQALRADAWHHRSDAFSSVVALAAIVAAELGGARWAFVDQVGAVLIGAVIAWTGISLYLDSARELMDLVVLGAPVEQLRLHAGRVDGVKAIEKVFIRKSGLDFLVDVHVQVDGDITVAQGHDIGHSVRETVMQKMPVVKAVLVHIEPYGDCSVQDDEPSVPLPARKDGQGGTI